MAIDYARLTIAADQATAAYTNLQTQCSSATPVEFMVLQPLLAKANELSCEIAALARAIKATEGT